MTIHNPIIPGFHPDPSICGAGAEYYIVNSSFEYFPGVPLFHSTDLVNWRQIGHCLNRPGQLPLEKMRASGGIFAPTIRFHDGRFYLVTTNVFGGGNFLVTATDPAGLWSDRIPIDQDGIDPSLFFDTDGTAYFTSTSGGSIVQSTLDVATGKRLTDVRPLWDGTGGQYPEGPHLYKIDGRYYLTISEGGTEYGHMVTVARGDSPWGPFVPCPRNPILTHRSVMSPLQATGHADLVRAHDGSWWMVFLGIRPNGYPPCHHLGRETFIAPVVWDRDGWPVIGNSGRAALEFPGPSFSRNYQSPRYRREEFGLPALDDCWNFLRNPRPGDWSLTERPGYLTLHGSAVSLDDLDSPAALLRRQEHFDFAATTIVEFDPASENEEAGLTVRMNETHHYEIAITRRGGGRSVVVRRRIGSLVAEVAFAPAAAGPSLLRVAADRNEYRFAAGRSESELTVIAAGETRYLSTEVAGGFTGVYIGIYASGNGAACTNPAYFDWFAYEPVQSIQDPDSGAEEDQ